MVTKQFQLTTVGSLLVDADQFMLDGFSAEYNALYERISAIYGWDVQLLVSDLEQNGWIFTHSIYGWGNTLNGESDMGTWELQEMFSPSDGVIGWCLSVGGSEGNSALSTYFMVL